MVCETQSNLAARSTVCSHIGTKPISVRPACHSGCVMGVRSCTTETKGTRVWAGPIVRAESRTSAPQRAMRRGSVVCTHRMPAGWWSVWREKAPPPSNDLGKGRGAKSPTSAPFTRASPCATAYV